MRLGRDKGGDGYGPDGNVPLMVTLLMPSRQTG